jgi:nitrite reductase/ring-hydroxylating ferredoxin subunit
MRRFKFPSLNRSFVWGVWAIGFAICVVLGAGCKKKSATSSSFVPNVAVDYQLSLSSPAAYPLNTPGGHIYLAAGYRGILVYRQTIDAYVAMDRACPHNPSDPTEQVAVDSSGLYAVCPACKSRYSLDGTLLKGPSTQSLRQYGVDVGADVLRVYN